MGFVRSKAERGVTLIELLIVVSLIALMVGITFPSISSGIDSIRLASAADSVAAFLNRGLSRAERLQEVVEIEIRPGRGRLGMRSSRPGFERTLELPTGVTVRRVLPELPAQQGAPRRILLFPGGTVPRITVELVNSRGAMRTVRIDPITGVPEIRRGGAG